MTINLINSSSAHFGAVRFVTFDPSNEKIISIGEDEGRLYIWNADTLSPATGTTIEEKTGNYTVRSAVFSDDFSFLFGGDDKTLTLADWPNCENYSEYVKSDKDIDFVSSKWDTKTIAYSDKHMISFHDQNNKNIPDLTIENDITWLDFSRDAKYFAISSSDSTVIIWNSKDFTEIFRKKYDLGTCHPSWGPADFLTIPISSSPGKVIIIKVDSLEEHEAQNPSEQIGLTTTVSLSNKFILAISDNSNQISFLQLNQDYSLTLFSTTKYSGSEFSSVSWGNVNTNLFAAGDTDGTIYLFELVENKKPVENEQEDIDDSDIILDLDKESKKVENVKNTDDKSSSKSINDVLKDKPNLMVMKPRTQPKKAKGKGKQQKLNLAKAPAQPKRKVIETKRQFISDHSDSSEEEEEIEIVNKNNTENKEQSKKNFLNDDDDFDDVIEDEKSVIPKPQKSFLNDDDENFDDIEIESRNKQSPPNSKKLFLSDNNEQELEDITESNIAINNDDAVPGYDDIALPDDDEDDVTLPKDNESKDLEIEKTDLEKLDEKEKETSISKLPNPYSSLSYLDCSSSSRFIPGSFKLENGKVEILCWNGEGSIVMHNRGYSDIDKYVEISPYGNSSFYSKKIEEANEINLGTIDEYGYLIATHNTVIYHRHNEYGPEAEIVKNFPFLEDIQLIACGSSFFAVATARKFLHIFSTAGFELSVITLNGRLITMVGHENYLFVVSGKHHFDLFDIFNRTLLASGVLPIHAPLRWAGFNRYDNSVLIESGNYQLLTLSYSDGVRWTPVIDLSNHLESSSNGLLHLFIVEVYGNQVSGIYLDKDADEIKTDPFPETLIDIDFDPPTIESLLDNCVLSIINYQNSNEKEKEANRFDKQLLKQFDSALRDDKLLLAYQIAKQMKTSRGIDLAIRICDQRGQSGVSERLIQIKNLKNEEEDYDESTDFEIDESTDEPEPFVRTEPIQKDDEEEKVEQTNTFLGRFNNEKETHKKDDNDNDKDAESDEEENKNKKINENESSEDDLDKFDDDIQKVNNSENSESNSKEVPKRNRRSNKEPKSKSMKSRGKSRAKTSNNDKLDDVNDDDNKNNNDNEQNDESEENEREEKKKSSSDTNVKKKPIKPKSTRKKLFSRTDKPSNMSVLDTFGFS